MTEPTTRIDGVRQQGCIVNDADQSMLVSVVSVDLMSAALWLVKRSGEATRIGKTPSGCPKIDSAWPACFPDGTARLCMAQADVGGGGATSHLTWIDFPDAVDPLPPPTAVDQAARNQANAATNIAKAANETATAAQSNAIAAVGQANAATGMAHSAISQNEVQDGQIVALDTRTTALESM